MNSACWDAVIFFTDIIGRCHSEIGKCGNLLVALEQAVSISVESYINAGDDTWQNSGWKIQDSGRESSEANYQHAGPCGGSFFWGGFLAIRKTSFFFF